MVSVYVRNLISLSALIDLIRLILHFLEQISIQLFVRSSVYIVIYITFKVEKYAFVAINFLHANYISKHHRLNK